MDKLGKYVCCAHQKRRKLRKLAYLLKTELFVVVEEGESFSSRVCSSCGTKVRNCAAMLSQIREKLNTPTDNDQLLRLKRMSKSPVRISVDRPNTTHKLAAMWNVTLSVSLNRSFFSFFSLARRLLPLHSACTIPNFSWMSKSCFCHTTQAFRLHY